MKQPVEAESELPDGKVISGIDELKRYLLDQRTNQFARAVVSRLTGYSLGRSIEFTDEPAIDAIAEKFEAADYRLRPLIHAIVQSELFQSK